jgi:hypothetical protein
VAVGNAALREIAGRSLDLDAVAGRDFDEVLPYLAGHRGQDFVPVFPLHAVHRRRQQLRYDAIHLQNIDFFYRLRILPNEAIGRGTALQTTQVVIRNRFTAVRQALQFLK